MNDTTATMALSQDFAISLAASPSFARDGVCFAARGSGLYRSRDGGMTWRSAYESLTSDDSMPTMAVALSPDFISDRGVFAGLVGGILRSFDAGHSWGVSSLPAPPPPLVSVLSLSPNFVEDGIILAGTFEDGIFRSTDRGASWLPSSVGLFDLCVLSMAVSMNFAQDGMVVIGTDGGIFRSTNGGRSWRQIDFPERFAPVLSVALSPAYPADNTIYAGTDSSGLFCSEDAGIHWTLVGEDIMKEETNSIILSTDFPAKPHILVLNGGTLLVSRDRGRSWAEWKSGFSGIHGISSVAAPSGLDANVSLLVGLIEGDVLQL